jgi:hypothetical protein
MKPSYMPAILGVDFKAHLANITSPAFATQYPKYVIAIPVLPLMSCSIAIYA